LSEKMDSVTSTQYSSGLEFGSGPQAAVPSRREGIPSGTPTQAGRGGLASNVSMLTAPGLGFGSADGFFRGRTVFDPPTIIAQICCCQATSYFTLFCLLYILATQRGFTLSLALTFDWNLLRLDSGRADVIAIATLLNTACNGALLRVVVGRTKQCLDFAATQHLIHFLAVCIYSKSFPVAWAWWILLAVSLAISTLLGEYLCMRYELQDISTAAPSHSSASSRTLKNTTQIPGTGPVTDGGGLRSVQGYQGANMTQTAGLKISVVPRTGSGPEGGGVVSEQIVTASSIATHRRTISRGGALPAVEVAQQQS